MKKSKLVFSVCLCSFVLFGMIGCGEKKTAENLTISLKENPTTGYTWSYEIGDTGIVKAVGDEYKSDGTQKTGSGGTHTFEFAGVKEGETKITFSLKRPWEDKEASETKEYQVVVDSSGTMKEK